MTTDMAGSTEVVVGPDDLAQVFFDGSVYVVTGTAGDKRVTFVGDHGLTGQLLRAIAESGEPQTALVEDWAITSSVTFRPCATLNCEAQATEVITYGGKSTNACTPCADEIGGQAGLDFQRRPLIARSA